MYFFDRISEYSVFPYIFIFFLNLLYLLTPLIKIETAPALFLNNFLCKEVKLIFSFYIIKKFF